MYVLPSLFTAGNMAAGYYAITQSIQGSVADQSYFDRAALALGIAVLFDGLDGMIARMTNTASDFGKELDSLADVITFGRGAEPAGLHVGVPDAAGDGTSAASRTADAYRDLRLLHLSHLRSEPAGAVQHQHQSSAAQSRAPGEEVFCRDADTGRRGRDQFGDPFPERVADR